MKLNVRRQWVPAVTEVARTVGGWAHEVVELEFEGPPSMLPSAERKCWLGHGAGAYPVKGNEFPESASRARTGGSAPDSASSSGSPCLLGAVERGTIQAVSAPSESVVKTLFALSGNVCSYEGCEEKLTDPTWRQVKAEIAHICGEKPGSARYDSDMTEQDRGAFENLILLCPNHHKLIDRLEPEAYPPERLRTMRDRHHRSFEGTEWASDSDLERFAALAVTGEPRARPFLLVEQAGQAVELKNVGDSTAYEIHTETPDQPLDRAWLDLATITPGSLAPGSSWTAGQTVPSNMISDGPFSIAVSWSDESGESYRRIFELSPFADSTTRAR
jgi:hypothetical protein